MRMAGPDIVLFVVGLVLFSGATYGLMTQEGGLAAALGGSSSALGVYQVSYTTHAHEVRTENVQNMAGTRDIAFVVKDGNITTATVTVTCSDPAAALPAGFSLAVRVQGPNGLAKEASATCAQGVTIDIPVAGVPSDTVVAGRTDTEARDNLQPAEDADKATGEWTVTVTGARQGQTGLPAGNPSGSVTLTITQWEPRFTPEQR